MQPQTARIAPGSARVLGWAGVLPFAVGAAALWLPEASRWELELTRAFVAYAAVLLSFIGGVRWGATLYADAQEAIDTDLVLAVIPSLLAWCVLLLPAASQQLFALSIAFLVFGALDAREAARGLWPRWYSRLRMQLSVAVLASLVVAGLAIR